MIYDALERAHAIADANFTTDFDVLVTAKSLAGLDTSIRLYKRQMAELFADEEELPGLGVYGTTTTTHSPRGPSGSAHRDSQNNIVYDYYAVGDDPEILSQQVELAAEVLAGLFGKMLGGTEDILDAGAPENSILVQLSPVAQIEGSKNFERRVTVSGPIEDRDSGL